MAFTKSANRTQMVQAPRRSGAVVSKARFNEAVDRARNAGKRLREATKEDESALVSVGTGIALAVAESKMELPTIGGIDPLLIGGVVGYALTRKSKNKSAGMLRTAAIAALTIGANRSYARGSVQVEPGDEAPDEDL